MEVIVETNRENSKEVEGARRNTELIETSVIRDTEGRIELILCECGLYYWKPIQSKCLFCRRE